MSRVGISKSILSISSPGTHLVAGNSDLAAKTARYCNSYASNLKRKHSSKFGYWAALPLPDVQLALDEMAKSADEGADGFTCLTNHHGHYLGDSIFDPIFTELNRRKAILFIHPTTPCTACDGGPVPATPLGHKYPNPMMEFFFETARVVTNLFMSGTVSRCPDITFLIPHCGGASPPLLSRWTGFASLIPGPWAGVSEDEAREKIEKQFYFDLAGFPFPGQIKGIKAAGASAKNLLYGSDFPFTKAEGVEMLAGQMDMGIKEEFTEEEVREIYEGNAKRLLGMS